MNNPDMSRKIMCANQTVKQGMFDVSYDEDGYATKAVRARTGSGYILDGVLYDSPAVSRPKKE